MLSYPVWYKMVQTQSIGIGVVPSSVSFVVDLRKLESCKTKKVSKIETNGWRDSTPAKTVSVWLGTLPRSRKQHLRLQPHHPVRVHRCSGRGVRQTDQIFSLLLLKSSVKHQIQDPHKERMKDDQISYLVDVQGNDISAHLWLGGHHGGLLHLIPVSSQVGQPEVVVDKLKAAGQEGRFDLKVYISKIQRPNAGTICLPFPGTQVHNQKSIVLVGVDVVKHSYCCSFELQINVLTRGFLGNVEIGLCEVQKKKGCHETQSKELITASMKGTLTPWASLDSKQSM